MLVDTILVGGVQPVVRWYDARQRCALRLLATWLRVPWKMVVNFECLLVYRLLLPPEEASKAKSTPWDQGVRAAKIGAASLGIGAIFAVTGDSLILHESYRTGSFGSSEPDRPNIVCLFGEEIGIGKIY